MASVISRRRFLRRSGWTAGATGLSALWASRVGGAESPNERVRLGLIGCGGRGRANLLLMLDAGAECVAVCDPDDRHAGQAVDEVLAKGQKTKPASCRDYHKLLDRQDIDGVLVSTPDHWHAIISIDACLAGKDVFVEKPVSHNVREGRAMVEAARKTGRIVQVGTQQRSGSHFKSARKYIESGALGDICLCRAWVFSNEERLGFPPLESAPHYVDYNLWLGPAPKENFNRNRFHYQWRWFWDYAGGKQVDWGVHLMDIIQWYMNVDAPKAVCSTGARWIVRDEQNTETPDTQATLFEYPNFTCVYEHRQANARSIEDESHGMGFYGENGTMILTRAGWEVHPEGKRIKDPPRDTGTSHQMFYDHARQFLRCVKTRATPNTDIETGHRSSTVCQLANVSLKVGRKIAWDAEKEEIKDDPEANALLSREYRRPFTLPRV